MKLSIIALLLAGAFAAYQYTHTQATAAPVPVQPVPEIVVVEPDEPAVLPPAPPDLGDITVGGGPNDVTITIDKPETLAVGSPGATGMSTHKAAPRVVKPEPDYAKIKEERKAKETAAKVKGYEKDLAELRGKLTAATQNAAALEGDLRAVQERYQAQEELERKRKSIRGDRSRGLPDGESKRLIDRDWNNTNNRLNTAYAYKNKLIKEIAKAEEKLAALKGE